MLGKWWEEFPERLKYELQALADVGITATLRQDAFEAGRVVLDVEMDATGVSGPSDLKLEVVVPEGYPYFRPIVTAPTLDLAHHQHPFDRNLCLLGRRSDEWLPEMTIASLLTTQLSLVMRANSGDLNVDFREIEEIQGEPIGAYYKYEPGSVCFVDGAWPLPDGRDGKLEVAFGRHEKSINVHVLRLLASDGTGLTERRVTPPLDGYSKADARWFRLDTAPRKPDAQGVLSELLRQHPAAGALRSSFGLDLILVAYPEELSHRQPGAGWLVLAREPQKSKGRVQNPVARLVRVSRAGESDMAARVLEWPAMRTTSIAIFGLGCLGAPIALELARNGAKHLWLIDDDIVDAGATVRWPFGLQQVGQTKVDVLKEFIARNYPYTQVSTAPWRIGTPAHPTGLTENELLREVIGSADVFVDATADYGVQYFLSDLALENDLAYIGAHGTHGGYGGEVISLRRGVTGCWVCLAWARQDGSIPQARAMSTDWPQPPGCEGRTFIGASFDLAEVSLAATRAVIESRLGEVIPDAAVRVLQLRDEAGRRILPSWRGYALPTDPSCTRCRARL